MVVKTSVFVLLLQFSSWVNAEAFPEMAGHRYDIGGYKLHIHCLGTGKPTVIIDVGLGDDSSDWTPIVEASSKTSKTCVYDRPGYGWSDISRTPRTSARIADELALLLKEANIPPPYILVGHSFGGFNMRLFAANNSDQIKGLILVDASHEDQYTLLDIALPPAHKSKQNIFIKTKWEHMQADDPKSYTLRDRAFRAASFEIAKLSTSSKQVKQAPNLPDIPLIIISRGKSEWFDDEGIEREKTWLFLQQDLTKLSAQSQHIFANKSGHNIPQEQPDIISDAISNLAQQVRVMSSP